jgi:Na+/H+ antiporter NhaD/arsenite permease-like protein
VNARPSGILLMLATVTAVFSALLDNVTTVLLIVPVTLLITEELNIKAYPFLVTEILASNIGGMATLIGDPPNIIIGSAAGLSFNDFIVNMAPISIIIFVVFVAGVHLFAGRHLHSSDEARARIMNFDENEAIKDPGLLKRSLSVLALVLAGFIFGHGAGMEPGTVALFGASALMLAAKGVE